MKQKREIWIDITKGLGIIGVVLGHSGNEIAHHYLFWFHMPLFFLLSGYTFKVINNKEEFLPWLKKRAKQLLIPYISFAIIITIVKFTVEALHGNLSLISMIKDCLYIVYGGQLLTGYYGVFWFITCLFITQVSFALIVIYFKNVKTQLAIIGILYLLSHVDSQLLDTYNIPIPWNMDVSLLAITYYAIGFYVRRLSLSAHKQKAIVIIASIISLSFIISDKFGLLVYELDLKKNIYNNLLLDLLIPLSLTVVICFIGYYISRVSEAKILATLGTLSLSIMYLHIPINAIGRYLTFDYGIFAFALIGITIPILINIFCIDKFLITRFLFLGSTVKNKNLNHPLNKKVS